MSLTLGLTGMDPATETALRAAFVDANARLGERWSLVPDGDADHVVVDMDSMYGPMSWLRLHAAGKRVIGLTSAPRTQTDYRLGRPFDTDQLMGLLAAIAKDAGIALEAGVAPARGSGTTAAARDPAPPVAPAPASSPAPATSAPAAASASAPAAAPGSAADSAPAAASGPSASAPAADPASEPVAAKRTATSRDSASPTSPSAPAADPIAAPTAATATSGPDSATDTITADPATTAPEPPAERTLATWLQPGALHGQRRYAPGSGPVLLIDVDAEVWHGPAALKPIAPLFAGPVDAADFEPLDAAAWAQQSLAAGPAQPLTRLRWLGGLLAGNGEVRPGVDPEGRFQLTKWPQTEREYPRHFRIATQMMKGPATVAEIAAGSGVPVADVADFVNANLATGFAEPVVEAPPAAEPAKPRGGLLGRLRR